MTVQYFKDARGYMQLFFHSFTHISRELLIIGYDMTESAKFTPILMLLYFSLSFVFSLMAAKLIE
jgi:hypothetical protein